MVVKAEVTTKVYKFVVSHILKTGIFPTLREISLGNKMTMERARQHLEKLVEIGYLKKYGMVQRGYTIRVVDLPKVDNNLLKKIKVANKKIQNHYVKNEARRKNKSLSKVG